MGFFSSYSAIGKINTLIKRLEPHLDKLADAIQNPYMASRSSINVECGTVSVLMDEIMSVVEESGSRSVMLAPYYLQGRKMSLMDISRTAAALIKLAENI